MRPFQSFQVPVDGGLLKGDWNCSDDPLVLIHGMGGDRRDWDKVIKAFPKPVCIVAYDLRGFGASKADDGRPFSHADDLRVLMDGLGIEKASLAGLSMGGGIALNFALGHPERVSHLCLVSPAMIGWEWSDEWKTLWRNVAQAARSGDIALARERWFAHPLFAQVRAGPAAEELRRSIQAYHGRQWIKDDQRDEMPDIERLHDLAVPTLLLTGEFDVPDLRLIADVIESATPATTRIDYAKTGHMLTLERPVETAQAIAQFISA